MLRCVVGLLQDPQKREGVWRMRARSEEAQLLCGGEGERRERGGQVARESRCGCGGCRMGREGLGDGGSDGWCVEIRRRGVGCQVGGLGAGASVCRAERGVEIGRASCRERV